jgi:hypothetical protein
MRALQLNDNVPILGITPIGRLHEKIGCEPARQTCRHAPLWIPPRLYMHFGYGSNPKPEFVRMLLLSWGGRSGKIYRPQVERCGTG